MTELLQQAIAQIEKLSPHQQAKVIIAKLEEVKLVINQLLNE